jgi:hypothetical protein
LIGSRRGRLVVPLGDGTTMAIWPGGVVRQSDGLDLGLEVFGLGAGEEARIRVQVAADEPGVDLADPTRWRAFPSGWSESRVSRPAGSGPIARWRVTLPLNRLKAGVWRLAVEVTDPAGRMVRREASFIVEQP